MGRLRATTGDRRPTWPIRALIVAVYVLLFWILLPTALWWLAAAIDGAVGWTMAPSGLGLPVLAAGTGLLAWGITELWTGGGGLPVSALPPPKLARRGPYRHCRHPIYLGFDVALLGAGLAVGSPALAFVLAPAFAPLWVLYARVEERGLVRRFGDDYRRYQRQVGWLPRWGLYRLTQLLMRLGLIPARVEGRQHVPAEGPCILVANHACYLDPCFSGVTTPRLVHYTTTAEAYRSGVTGVLVRRFVNVPVRRYRADPRAMREVLRLLAEGEVIGIFPEGERSPLGDYQGALPDVAGILARLPVPVVPIGISGAYDVGPRWAQILRRRPVHVVVGPPIDFTGQDPQQAIDAAVLALLDRDPQRVDLRGLPMERVERVLWACPHCFDEGGWQAAALSCRTCSSTWAGTPDGLLDGPGGPTTLAALARPLWDRHEAAPLATQATGSVERDLHGPLQPLDPLGEGLLEISADALRFGELHLSMAEIRSASTERADTLQVATATGMWQFRLEQGSVFRLHRAVERWRTAARPPARRPLRPAQAAPPTRIRPARPRWRAPTAGLAVAAGLLVTEGVAVVRPLMDGFGAGGAGGPMVAALASYALVGGTSDLAMQALPHPAARSGWLRGAAAVLVGGVIILGSGQVLAATLLALSGAALWALLVHGRWPLVSLAVLVATWALLPALPRPEAPGSPPPTATAKPDAPSILLVVLDTLRKDRASPWREDGRDTTPHLAGLAARGTRFDRAWSTSCWSLPAHASMLTGHLPTGHGAHYEHLHLDETLPTLAEGLTAVGYDTAGFSANPLVAPGTGLARGFTVFEEPWRTYTLREALIFWRVATRFAATDRDKGGAEVVAAARGWLDQRPPDRPWFALVNLMEAHVPYQEVPLRWRRAWVDDHWTDPQLEALGERSHMAQVLGTALPDTDRAATLDLLDGATAAADAYLGELLAAVEAGDQPTLVVVVSDHGELLGEHGLWGHNLGLWEPLLDVPVVIAGPGVRAGQVSSAPVSLVDLFPTLLSVGGATAPPSQGLDLTPLLHGKADGTIDGKADGNALADRVLRAEHLRTDFLTSGWQLLRPFADHAATRARRAAARRGDSKRMLTEHGLDQGYDLAADPLEQAPFPGSQLDLPLTLPQPGAVAPLPSLDPAQVEALRALGYLR